MGVEPTIQSIDVAIPDGPAFYLVSEAPTAGRPSLVVRAEPQVPIRRIATDTARSLDADAVATDAGDVWTWTAIDADSKLAVSWFVGSRDAGSAYEFMQDVASRLKNRVQLTTDAHKPYLSAVEDAFGADIDYAVLQKIYGTDPENETRYSPAKCLGCEIKTVSGEPNPKHISTSYVERQNLTMRMHMRRFTRLTNAFSKKIEMHEHAVALHFMHYNFVRVHQTLRVTPAMAAGVTDRLWEIGDIVALLPH